MSHDTSLVKKLFGEVFQTERSAKEHPLVEAERLGACPPGEALRAVSQHATTVEPELILLAEQRGVESSKLGLAVGSFFSASRNWIADFSLSSQESYRATMLGMRHGYDVISLFGAAAKADGDKELAAWCDQWKSQRGPLIERAADALTWFATHPDIATQNAKVHVEKLAPSEC